MLGHKTTITKLPTPTSQEAGRSQKLLNTILGKLQGEKTWMSFDEYMRLALYTPTLGYYSANTKKIGLGGDFTTAPEISALFSYSIAHQLKECLSQLSGPKIIVEVGAGLGTMASDIITQLAELDALPDAYHILEASSSLKKIQQDTLQKNHPSYFDKIHWLTDVPSDNYNGVIIANELLDAFPIHRFSLTDEGIFEQGISEADGQLAFKERLPTDEMGVFLQEIVDRYQLYPPYELEFCFNLSPWFNSMTKALHQGYVLLFDYGYNEREYFHPSRVTGTLKCHYQQRVNYAPLLYPGLQDITAHVNFTEAAIQAEKHDLAVCGYTTQAEFLLRCGLLELAHSDQLSTPQRLQISHQITQLTSPNEMGQAVKVLALSKGEAKPLTLGFDITKPILL